MPLVSVLLPVFNAAPDLPRAIHSLGIQTLKDFEVIAIDDGSTDGSGQLLDEFSRRDPRIKVVHQDNAGTLSKVLNTAAQLARGKYLARQDADDASDPTRLQRQVQYMETNPKTGLCGTWVWYIESNLGPFLSHELPDNHKILLRFLEKGMNPLTHGSVMMRTDLFQQAGGYRGSFSEDLDLWIRLSEKTRLGMVTHVGYYYWRSTSSISVGATLRQKALNQLIIKLHAERIGAGHEITDWNSEYERIANTNPGESQPEERQAAIHYARALNLLRMSRWTEYRLELQKSSLASGPYAQKAKRNLRLAWAAPLLRMVYRITEMREPFAYARRFKPGTPLPEFLAAGNNLG